MSKPPKNWTIHQFREYLRTGVSPILDDNAKAPEKDFQVPPLRSSPTGMNKTETEYHHILENMLGNDEISDIFPHESIKVRIGVAGARCWYTPDFAVIRAGRLEFHEVKGGFVHDDARVKFESARAQYPQFGWVWAQKKQGTWKVK